MVFVMLPSKVLTVSRSVIEVRRFSVARVPVVETDWLSS